MIYKLIMNSSYGRNLMKAIEYETHMFYNQKDYEIFESRNYNQIYESTCFGKNCYKIKTYKSLLDHFSSPHVGCNILSMSKRIMNEVMCLAEDNGISIFYQDTDSMHIPHNDISRLSNLFEMKYNRKLIGKNMGQFHTDFSLNDKNGKPCKDITAVACVFNGKKCYIDKLKGYDEDGNVVYGYHIRMKGVPTDVVRRKAEIENITPFDLYEKLFKGEIIDFNLLDNGTKAGKTSFMFSKDYTIETRRQFTRKIKF